MGKWNAGNVVAGLAIVGGVGAGVALMARDADVDAMEQARERGRESAAKHSQPWPAGDGWYLQKDTPVCPTKEAIGRLTQLAVDRAAFDRHFLLAGCAMWPGSGESVGLVARDWSYCEIAHHGRTAWAHCEHLGRR